MSNYSVDPETLTVVEDDSVTDDALRGMGDYEGTSRSTGQSVEGDEDFDPSQHSVDEVKAYVEANPDFAADISEAEAAGKNRVTLVEWLDTYGES